MEVKLGMEKFDAGEDEMAVDHLSLNSPLFFVHLLLFHSLAHSIN